MSDKLREARAVAKRYLDCITDDMPPEVKLPTVNELGDALLSVVAALAQPQNDREGVIKEQIVKIIKGHCTVTVQGEHHAPRDGLDEAADKIAALALQQNDQEAVAYMFWNEPDTQRHFSQLREAIGSHWANVVPLYTAPPSSRMREAMKHIECATRNDFLTANERLAAIRIVANEALRAGDNHASEQKVTENSDGGVSIDAYAGLSRDELKARCRELSRALSKMQFTAMFAAVDGGNKLDNVREPHRSKIENLIDAYDDEPDNHASDGKVCRCFDDRSREFCLDKEKCRPMAKAFASDGKESEVGLTGNLAKDVAAAAKRVSEWSDAKQDYARRAAGSSTDRKLPSDDLGAPLERIRTEAARMGYALVPNDREAIARIIRSACGATFLNGYSDEKIQRATDELLALRGGE